MDKREKAIIVSMIANGCEYRKEMAVINDKEYEIDEFNRIVELADKALEKQIPKKPIGRHTSYKCPICDRRVRSGKGSSSFGVDYFCQRCGQALEWSDTE